MENLENLIAEVNMKNSILFLGAGFNHKLTNSRNKSFPLANDLKIELENLLGIENSEETIDTLSDIYLSENDSNSSILIKKLEEWFFVGNINDDLPQSTILSFPWKRIYTVNYDNVAECISANVAINRTSVTISKKVKDYINRDLIIHLNGSVNNLSKQTLKSEFKLSSTSYLQTDFINSEWHDVFKNDIENASNIFFVGVSMKSDFDISRILVNDKEYKEKIHFIDRYISLKDTKNRNYQIETHRQRSFGTLHNIGLENFSQLLKSYGNKVIDKKVHFRCFNFFNELKFNFTNATGLNVRDLLVHGDINEGIISSQSNTNNYLIHREIEDKILKTINESDYKIFLLIGQMANGKSCIVNNLKNSLKSKGNVFIYDRFNDNIQNEIEEISRIIGLKYIIIENYYKYFEIIEKLGLYLDFNDSSTKLILSGRPFPNESMQYELPKLLRVEQSKIKVYGEEIDTLTDNDILLFDKLIHKANFLESEHQRKHWNPIPLYNNKYKRQIYNILIDLIHNKQVSNELIMAYKDITKNKNAESIIIASSICTVIGTDISFSNLQEILCINDSSLNVYNDKDINLFVSFSDKYVKNKSSILSNFVLSECTDTFSVLQVLKRLVLNSDKSTDKQVSKNIKHDFISSSNIYSLLYPIEKKQFLRKRKNDNIREEVLEYYNDIKDLSDFKNNIFFWVQFAMACMDYKDYDRAFSNLYVASTIVEQNKNKRSFFSESVQVTTQLARCTLEHAISTNAENGSFQLIIETNRNLLNLIKNEEKTKHYLVYKQMGIYKDYYQNFKHTFLKTEIKILYDIIVKLENEIETYASSNLFLGDRNVSMIRNVVSKMTILKQSLLIDYSTSEEEKNLVTV